MLYHSLRNLLFCLDPEVAHTLCLNSLKLLIPPAAYCGLGRKIVNAPVKCMGLTFPNAVGLAAGLDKNAEYIDALAALGFGFIEIGTVTPRAQDGNPQPRLFRIPEQQALINRLGFNNKGIDVAIANIQQSNYKGILGINIGKNKDTPNENAVEDYLICLRKAYAYASYITVNISSPNTPGLRNLQSREPLNQLLAVLIEERKRLADQHGKQKPLLVKIAPDLNDTELDVMADVFLQHKIDGIIISNTTLSRPDVTSSLYAQEAGGLSGKPLMPLATLTLGKMAARLQKAIPLIGVGGITTTEDAVKKIQTGASLVQIYTGFIYQGPALIKDAAQAISKQNKKQYNHGTRDY